MKRVLTLLTVILPPYVFAVWIVAFIKFSGSMLILWIAAAGIVLYIAALACSFSVLFGCVDNRLNAREILRMNMFVKVLHIPAYLVIFIMGVGFALSFFLMPFVIVLLALNCLTIFMSGLIGAGGLFRGAKENMFTKQSAVILGILQFIFCADVISSAVIYDYVCGKNAKRGFEYGISLRENGHNKY